MERYFNRFRNCSMHQHQPVYNPYARKEPIAMLTAGVIERTYYEGVTRVKAL